MVTGSQYQFCDAQYPSELLDLSTMTWSIGPDNPNGIACTSWGESIPYKSSFLTVGGYDKLNSRYSDEIWYFDSVENVWTQKPSLSSQRELFSATLIQDDLCSATALTFMSEK